MWSFSQILIGLSCSIIFLSSLFQWYFVSKKLYLRQKEEIVLQDKARLGLTLLIQDLQNSGFLGARSKDSMFPLQIIGKMHPLYLNQRTLVRGGNICALEVESACKLGKPESEGILIWHVPKNRLFLKNKVQKNDQEIIIHPAQEIVPKNAMVLISDRIQGDLISLDQIVRKKAEYILYSVHSASLSKSYDPDSEVYVLQTVLYYVGRGTYRKGNASHSRFGLYRQVLGSTAVEVVDNVKDLQFSYGVLENQKAIVYKKAFEITDWSQVKTVRITLVLDNVSVSFSNAIPNVQSQYEVEVGLRNAPYS